MNSAFNVGDLIRHSTIGHVINRGYGIVLENYADKNKMFMDCLMGHHLGCTQNI